jgi:ubiquitin carboxyl-terminal hydrolase 8
MDKTEKYKDKGYTGLTNLGNTCFLNSCMQVINHTYELHAFFDSEKCAKHMKPDADIINEWRNLRDVMWSQNCVVSPNRFIQYVQQMAQKKGRELFTGWAQNDLTEFLLFMVECMHNSICRPVKMRIYGEQKNRTDVMAIECYKMLEQTYSREYSEIMDMFYGIYVSQITTPDGSSIHSVKPEHFFILDLEIPRRGATLYDCLDAFTKSEMIEGENAWYNEKTLQKEDVMKQILFWNFPNILIITLKRFSADGRRKIQDLVDFPLENLDLSKYVQGYNPSEYIYDLFGVCNHVGGPLGGHYTAFVRHICGEWVHFNDTHLDRNIPLSKMVTPMAYCLFYRKKNNLV